MHARQPPCSFTPAAGNHVVECFYLHSCPVGAAVVLGCAQTHTRSTPNETAQRAHEGGMRTAMPFCAPGHGRQATPAKALALALARPRRFGSNAHPHLCCDLTTSV